MASMNLGEGRDSTYGKIMASMMIDTGFTVFLQVLYVNNSTTSV